MSQAGRAVLPVANNAMSQLGRVGAGAVNQVGRAVTSLPSKVVPTAKFMAGVPANQPFAPTPLAGARNVARAAIAPRYPGLDRAPGAVGAVARPLDRTRQNIARGMRGASGAASLASGAVVADGLLNRYPNFVANQISSRAGLHPDDMETMRDRARAEAPGYYAELAKQQVGLGAQDPLSQMHGEVARKLLVPTIRNDVYEARKQRPWLFGAIDAARSFTPAGAAITAASRMAGSEEAPDWQGTLRDASQRYATQMSQGPPGAPSGPRERALGMGSSRPTRAPSQVDQAASAVQRRAEQVDNNLEGVANSPFTQAYSRVLSPGVDAAAADPRRTAAYAGWRNDALPEGAAYDFERGDYRRTAAHALQHTGLSESVASDVALGNYPGVAARAARSVAGAPGSGAAYHGARGEYPQAAAQALWHSGAIPEEAAYYLQRGHYPSAARISAQSYGVPKNLFMATKRLPGSSTVNQYAPWLNSAANSGVDDDVNASRRYP